jgi:polyisoprenoid-binding protein YceI
MKTKIVLFIFISLSGFNAIGQTKYFTKTGYIKFFSATPIEDIKGENNLVGAVLAKETGALDFVVGMKSFQFEKGLMQEHFNENYVESEKYPKATFKGKVDNISEIDFSKDGEYAVMVSGDLTIHGVTNKITQKGTISIKEGKINANSVFPIALADYKVEIPALVRKQISETVEVTVNLILEELVKK